MSTGEAPGGAVTVSVIVPSRNAAGTLADQLAALCAQTYTGSWEVVVVDHASTDATAQVAQAWADRLPVRVVQADAGGGVSRSRNVGIAHARGTLLLFCDSDDLVDPRWVDEMVRALDEFDLVGGTLVSFAENARVYEWHGTIPGQQSDNALLAVGDRFSFRGANMAMRAAAIGTLRFPEWYTWPGGEEVDFCLRAQLAGARLGAAPAALVNYRLRSSFLGMLRQHFWWGFARGCLKADYPSFFPRSTRRRRRKVRRGAVALRNLVLPRRSGDRRAAPRQLAMLTGQACGAVRFRRRFRTATR